MILVGLASAQSPHIADIKVSRISLPTYGPSKGRRLVDGQGCVEMGPTAFFETEDVVWAVETLTRKGWLSRVPRLDTGSGRVPWGAEAAMRMLRARQDYSVDTLRRLTRSPYVLRTNPAVVGRRYVDVGLDIPLIQTFDRKGQLVAYGTRRDHWIFVALPTGFPDSPRPR